METHEAAGTSDHGSQSAQTGRTRSGSSCQPFGRSGSFLPVDPIKHPINAPFAHRNPGESLPCTKANINCGLRPLRSPSDNATRREYLVWQLI